MLAMQRFLWTTDRLGPCTTILFFDVSVSAAGTECNGCIGQGSRTGFSEFSKHMKSVGVSRIA